MKTKKEIEKMISEIRREIKEHQELLNKTDDEMKKKFFKEIIINLEQQEKTLYWVLN